jgi:hypothetical protein
MSRRMAAGMAAGLYRLFKNYLRRLKPAATKSYSVDYYAGRFPLDLLERILSYVNCVDNS